MGSGGLIFGHKAVANPNTRSSAPASQTCPTDSSALLERRANPGLTPTRGGNGRALAFLPGHDYPYEPRSFRGVRSTGPNPTLSPMIVRLGEDTHLGPRRRVEHHAEITRLLSVGTYFTDPASTWPRLGMLEAVTQLFEPGGVLTMGSFQGGDQRVWVSRAALSATRAAATRTPAAWTTGRGTSGPITRRSAERANRGMTAKGMPNDSTA